MTIQRITDLPMKTKARLFAGIAALIGGGLLIGHFTSGRANAETPPAAQPAAAAPGTFRPSKGQLDALKIAPVQALSFRTEQITDGSIATNDDTTTQVFSPYSGHVSKLFAKLGDTVQKGTPLMAVEASEFVQGQNDLIAARCRAQHRQRASQIDGSGGKAPARNVACQGGSAKGLAAKPG